MLLSAIAVKLFKRQKFTLMISILKDEAFRIKYHLPRWYDMLGGIGPLVCVSNFAGTLIGHKR